MCVCVCVCVCVYFSTFSKKQATEGKTQMKTFPQTVYTSAQLNTAISKRKQTLYGKETRQHCIL